MPRVKIAGRPVRFPRVKDSCEDGSSRRSLRNVYILHPSPELRALFAAKPYQGVAPDKATFLFVGLDANYDEAIDFSPVFPFIREYHTDGVAFWRRYGVHHPFLLPQYSGDGQLYHRSFARIGFGPQHANLVSFVELLHVPTVGRDKLARDEAARSRRLRRGPRRLTDRVSTLDRQPNEGHRTFGSTTTE